MKLANGLILDRILPTSVSGPRSVLGYHRVCQSA